MMTKTRREIMAETYEEVMAAPVGYLLYTEEACTDRECGCGGATHPQPVLETMFVDFRWRQLPALPEAARSAGVAYITTAEDRDGRQKVVLGGASPLTVRAFLGAVEGAGYVDENCSPARGYVQAHGLVDSYGDPERGFAEAYFDPAREALTPLGLARLRQELGLNQAELAQALCLSESEVFDMETGARPVSVLGSEVRHKVAYCYRYGRRWFSPGPFRRDHTGRTW